jgi:amino acid adenylation domain-containing protein
VIYEDQSLTYAKLNARANQLAHYLRAQGIGPEEVIGLCVERSVEMLIGLLGIMKAGGAYLPLDPTYPPERLSYMLEDAGVKTLLTQQSLLAGLPDNHARAICLDSDWDDIARCNLDNPVSGVTPENLAYVIYTSGSTGRPKGTMLRHKGLSNLSEAQIVAFDIEPQARVLQFSSLSFDASIFEIAMALRSGAALSLVTREAALSGAPLAALLREQEVTNVTLTPSVLSLLPGESLPALQTIIVAGEACPTDLVKRWAPGRRFFNAYGPTETTVWASVSECVADGRTPEIGKPIINVKIHLLDANLQPEPVGSPGELCIGGVGLARGYLGRPDLTAEKFIPDPFGAEPGRRLYRTGDLAHYLPDGAIDFLGRIDHQVKLRGFRIELGEIEAAIARQPAVQQAVVVSREETPGDKRLVAYVIPKAGQRADSLQLRQQLRSTLPEYMVPAAFVTLDALPLTPNGKVDRQALPRPDLSNLYPGREAPPPRNPWELQLTYIWQDILSLERVGVTDNFFDLGGHSLLAMRMLAQIRRRTGQELPLAALIGAGTIERLANLLMEKSVGQPSPLVPIKPEGKLLPLFCLHPGGGNVICYLPLAERLDHEQPVFGIQDPAVFNLDDGKESEDLYAPMEDMAARYILAIQSVQAEGPYLLCGWSFGGFMAYEIAQQLTGLGHEVALLAVLDTGPVYEKLGQADDAELLAILCEESGLEISASDLRKRSYAKQLELVSRRLKKTGGAPIDIPTSWIRRSINIFKTRIRVALNYQIKPYPGTITLIRAAEQDSTDGTDLAADPTMGWGKFSPRPVEVLVTPGNHATMGQEPHVKFLSETLQALIGRARGKRRDAA